MKAAEIRLVEGRLKFGGAKNSAPCASAVIVFRPGGNSGVPVLGVIRKSDLSTSKKADDDTTGGEASLCLFV
jgi:hypothetical protein